MTRSDRETQVTDEGQTQSSNAGQTSRSGNDHADSSIPLAEWAVAAVGAALLAGTVGFIGYQAFTGDKSAPRVVIEAESVSPSNPGFLVQVRARNAGGTTASQVKIEGTLRADTIGIETSDVVLDYLPAHSVRKAGLFFKRDPGRYTLELSAKSYNRP